MERNRLILVLVVVIVVAGLFDYFSTPNFASNTGSVISAIIYVGTLALVVLFLFWVQSVILGRNVQKLRVNVDVPEGTSKEALPLILDDTDLIIFQTLMKHGKLNQKTRQITYRGKSVYASRSRVFVIGKTRIAPHLLQVVYVE
jgi:hypothetical protein